MEDLLLMCLVATYVGASGIKGGSLLRLTTARINLTSNYNYNVFENLFYDLPFKIFSCQEFLMLTFGFVTLGRKKNFDLTLCESCMLALYVSLNHSKILQVYEN